MKIAVLGLDDFTAGKKSLIDDRVSALEELVKPSKTTFITLELLDASSAKEADAIICEKDAKLDLIISDMVVIENRMSRAVEGEDTNIFKKAQAVLEKNLCLCEGDFTEEEKKTLFGTNLASIRPVNFVDKAAGYDGDKILFDAYYAAGTICFITGAKDKELRAWPIKKGTPALEAAGVIHSDIQRGFIKAEIIDYNDLIKAGSLHLAKPHMHLEGKEYVMKDCDFVSTFRFNV
ncbi:MAG: DUF933 domain-containing protein [Candidatus Omnitrophica bacterium]|nr:DUF933 domain-containing protein [Candidatus Omnitrophota bacterium]